MRSLTAATSPSVISRADPPLATSMAFCRGKPNEIRNKMACSGVRGEIMVAICKDSCPYVTEPQVLLGRYVDDYSRIASVLHYSSGIDAYWLRRWTRYRYSLRPTTHMVPRECYPSGGSPSVPHN